MIERPERWQQLVAKRRQVILDALAALLRMNRTLDDPVAFKCATVHLVHPARYPCRVTSNWPGDEGAPLEG